MLSVKNPVNIYLCGILLPFITHALNDQSLFAPSLSPYASNPFRKPFQGIDSIKPLDGPQSMQRTIMEALSRIEEGRREMARTLVEGQKEIAKMISEGLKSLADIVATESKLIR